MLLRALLVLVVVLTAYVPLAIAQLPETDAKAGMPAQASTDEVKARPSRLTFSGIDEDDEGADDEGTGDTARSARDLLSDMGIPLFAIESLQDGEAPTAEETVLRWRLLARVPDIPLATAEKWVRDDIPWDQLQQGAIKHRGEYFYAQGTARQVRRVNLDRPNALRYQLPRYYEVLIELDESQGKVLVLARDVPKQWLPSAGKDAKDGADEKRLDVIEIEERATAVGMYLRTGEGTASNAPIVLVARRVAWPDEEVLLGNLGVDMGLFDRIRNGTPLNGHDRECFYQMLYAVDEAGTDTYSRYAKNALVDLIQAEMAKVSGLDEQIEAARTGDKSKLREIVDANQSTEKSGDPKPPLADVAELQQQRLLAKSRIEHAKKLNYPLIPLLENPSQFQGDLMMFRGVARQITYVRVDDPDIQKRFGITEYYQIDAIVELEAKVRLPGEEKVKSEYPVTFCVRRLPQGMPIGNYVAEEIVVPAFFFKNWVYQLTTGQERKTPMFVGRELYWILPDPNAANPYSGIAAGSLFLVAILGIWIAVWRYNRSDRAFHESTVAQKYSPEPGVSLNDLNLDSSIEPDFRHLH